MTSDRGDFQKRSTAELAAATNGDGRSTETPPAGSERTRDEHGRDEHGGEQRAALFGDERSDALMRRWDDIQAQFVDAPRESVEQADALVAEVVQELTRSFADQRSELERQWQGGENVVTEDLRLALQRYRSFFHRLLAA